MLVAAMAYNLKKLINHTSKKAEGKAKIAEKTLLHFLNEILGILSPHPVLNF